MANIDPTAPIVATEIVDTDDRSYVDWPAILAGTVLATAISFVLLTFGSAIGLSMTSAYENSGASLFWIAIVGALWLLWVQISSFFAGGYVAGRLRRRHGDATEHESDIRDGSHGLIVWGVSVLLGAFIAFWGISGTVNTAANTAGAVGQTVGTAAGQAAGEIDPNALFVDRALRGGAAGADPVGEETRSEVGRILLSSVAEGGMDAGDREYLITVVSQRAGIEPAEAEQRIDQIVQQAQQIEAEVREAAETARRVGMVAAFIAAASLLVSAAAAYYAATLGGNHRDRHTVFADWSRPW